MTHERRAVLLEADAEGTITPSEAAELALLEALERERDLRDALVATAKFHVAHDDTVRHPDGCNDCRAFAERASSRASTPSDGA